MENLYYPKITVFKSLFNSNDTPYQVDVSKILLRIKTGSSTTKELVLKIRSEKDKSVRDSIKKQLPAIMFNGLFQTRNENGIIEHSGLCIFDFDGYPNDEVLKEERKRIENDKYTYSCFLSPSGKGLKLLVKIPKSNKDEHYRRFHSYKKYISSPYFDEVNSNLSRVCFDSYDPDIFYNPSSEIFNEIEEIGGKTYIESVPLIILRDYGKIIDKILKFDFKCSFSEGYRNQYIFSVACAFCEYEIPQDVAESYLSRYREDNFGVSEIINTVKSAYKKSSLNPKKYFEDYETKKIVEKKISHGVDDKIISKELNIEEVTVKEIKKEINSINQNFWEIKKTKKYTAININSILYKKFLTVNGFNKYYPENAEMPVFVRVIENKVKICSVDQIKDFVLNWLYEKKEIDVWNYMAENTKYFNERYLNCLDPIHLKMLFDSSDNSFIPYLNGVLKVTKTKVELIDYIDIDAYIWENHIIQRDYIFVEDYDNDFKDFVSKVTNDDPIRTKSLETTIGYLLHGYKDKTHQKAVIFNDQEIDDNPNGGSGKSLMVTALSKFRNVVKIDGKQFNPNKSDFVYQRVNIDTQILAFDDVKRNFDMEQLFPLITEGITVNRKNKDEIFIPFERSPKPVITTNYVISGAGESHDRRRHEVEFYQFFNKKNSPLKVYGKLLFDQWDQSDWAKFDNYMISNLQLFLVEGLVSSPSINVDTKRLISSTCKEFYDFMNEGFIEYNKIIYNFDAMKFFVRENKMFKDLDTRKLMKWIHEFVEYKGFKLKKGKDHKGRYFMIVTVPEEDDQYKIEI
jgi:hypothetical protein